MKFSVRNEFRVDEHGEVEWQNKLQFDYTRKWRILKHMMFIIQNESPDEYFSKTVKSDSANIDENIVMPFNLKAVNSVCQNNIFKKEKKIVCS